MAEKVSQEETHSELPGYVAEQVNLDDCNSFNIGAFSKFWWLVNFNPLRKMSIKYKRGCLLT